MVRGGNAENRGDDTSSEAVFVHAPTKDISRPLRALALVATGLILCAGAVRPLVARAATFDPLDVIPYETFRGASSMSAADIQAFLATQSGPLKSLTARDHNGVKKPASQIIYEAATAWNLNPKVVMSTLQKEQSLITVSNAANSTRYLKAMGCGVYDNDHDGKVENTYPGFGNQVWNGTRKLSTYELPGTASGQLAGGWQPGYKMHATAYKTVNGKRTAYQKYFTPLNASTFALYTYTPYYPQSLVWTVYVRFFGDPATPPRLRPLYRFRSKSNGTYYYTASEAKRYTLIRTSSRKWSYEGKTLTVDTSATANVDPLYRLYNTRTHVYTYTVRPERRDQLLRVRPVQWRNDGAIAFISRSATGTAPVYKLENKRSHFLLFTASSSTKKKLTTGHSPAFTYRGVSFYLGASEPATPAVGPAPAP
jgi:hypothetical protein